MSAVILQLSGFFAIGFCIPYIARAMARAYPCNWHSFIGDALIRFMRNKIRRKSVKVLREKNMHNSLKKRYILASVGWGGLMAALFGFMSFMPGLQEEVSVFDHIFLFLLAVSALVDAKYGIIPDILTFPMLIVAGLAWEADLALFNALVAYGLCIALALPLYFKHPYGFGGGDVALVAVLAAFEGIEGLAIVVVGAAALAVAYAIVRRRRFVRFAPFLFAAEIAWIFAGALLDFML